MELDIKYLSESFSVLTGLPVRLYKNNKEIFYHSIIDFVVDPIILDLDNILSLNEKHIGYYTTSDFFYYGYINYSNIKFVIGPLREVKADSAIINNLCYRMNLNKENSLKFKNAMSFLNPMPLNSLLQALITLNYTLNNEKVFIKDLIISDITYDLEINEQDKFDIHNTYDIEKKIINIIKSGDLNSLIEFANESNSIRGGNLSNNYLRTLKNTFIVAATLASRAAIEVGLDVNESLSISDSYISNMELENDPKIIITQEFKMIYDYTKRVSYIKANSKLELEINKYILNNLDKNIKTSEVAEYLFMSRTNLSKIFKEKTGKTLHEYIISYKVNYSKELIKKGINLSIISDSLGFVSQSHFCNTFKKITMLTPTQYKNKI